MAVWLYYTDGAKCIYVYVAAKFTILNIVRINLSVSDRMFYFIKK